MARCNICGMFGCRHGIEGQPVAKGYSSDPYGGGNSDRKKKDTLKAFYAEMSKAQARTPNDWYKCDCGAMVHGTYKESHIEKHHLFGGAPGFTKIDSDRVLNGLDNGDEILTVEESLGKLTKACEGCTGDEACCAIVGLKSAGWDVEINPAMAHGDRKGYQITILEPKKR